MSNFLAVATASATLRSLVDEAAQTALPGTNVSVTNDRPDNVDPGDGNAAVSVYLYQVTPNSHWSNVDLPTRRGDGSLLPDRPIDYTYAFERSGHGEPSKWCCGFGVRAIVHRQACAGQPMSPDC